MKFNLVDEITEKLIATKCKNSEVSDLEKKRVKYGVYVLYVNITKIAIFLLISLLFDVFYDVLIIWFMFALIRSTAFGIHSGNSIVCTIVTVLTFVGGSLICRYCYLNDIFIYLIYLLCFILIFIYAPADTESRPLVGVKYRRKLKIQAVLITTILLAVVIVLNIYHIKLLFAIALIAETVSILPITYKIFKRRYNNYEYKFYSKSKG